MKWEALPLRVLMWPVVAFDVLDVDGPVTPRLASLSLRVALLSMP